MFWKKKLIQTLLALADNHVGVEESIAAADRGRSEEVENRIGESQDSSLRIPSSAGQEEEAALEDVLIITTDKSLESLDEMLPREENGDGQRKKDRSRDKDDSREKVKERVKRFRV